MSNLNLHTLYIVTDFKDWERGVKWNFNVYNKTTSVNIGSGTFRETEAIYINLASPLETQINNALGHLDQDTLHSLGGNTPIEALIVSNRRGESLQQTIDRILA